MKKFIKNNKWTLMVCLILLLSLIPLNITGFGSETIDISPLQNFLINYFGIIMCFGLLILLVCWVVIIILKIKSHKKLIKVGK